MRTSNPRGSTPRRFRLALLAGEGRPAGFAYVTLYEVSGEEAALREALATNRARLVAGGIAPDPEWRSGLVACGSPGRRAHRQS